MNSIFPRFFILRNKHLLIYQVICNSLIFRQLFALRYVMKVKLFALLCAMTNVRYVYAWMVCVYVYMCVYVYVHVCLYECIHACMHICMYVHVYIMQMRGHRKIVQVHT
jgi:hypothetical protein